MRCLIYADPHWSSYSSIVRSRGKKYSTRLENLLNTINWIEQTAINQNCDAIICVGDFFDKCDLNSEELTALQEIIWSDKLHYFITGNHEMGRGNLEFSSAHLFNLCPNTFTIDTVSCINDDENCTNIVLLPYILESNRKPLIEYIQPYMDKANTIVLSHNDISGVQMGQYMSRDGFSIDEIQQHCTLFINGHLHNGTKIGKQIINLGNITGQNFSEDANMYKHHCMILDTMEHTIDYYDNPYAMNFYKLDFVTYQDNDKDCKAMCQVIDNLKDNAVITVKIGEENSVFIRDLLANSPKLLEYRVLIDMAFSTTDSVITDNKDLSINHINKFAQYIKENVGGTDIILEELERIVGSVE